MNLITFGDCRKIMEFWALCGVKAQTCVTSPPYFGLRDYGVDGQLGLEATPEEYITNMVEVFRCVRDLLPDDGTLWLNIGDSYASSPTGSDSKASHLEGGKRTQHEGGKRPNKITGDLKHKDLIGIPWMLAFALRADGWYLRQDIIWHKPNPMPESVTDRCTKAHEYLFLLSKSQKYFFDSDAIKEPAVSTSTTKVPTRGEGYGVHKGVNVGADRDGGFAHDGTRNRRDVWTIATKPYKGAHFATFPTALVEPCVLAGSRPGDIVLDPFMGSGTTAAVAVQHGRKYLGCELNPEYGSLQQERILRAL